MYGSTDGGASWKALGATSKRDDSAAPYVGTGIGHWMGALAIDPFDSGHVLYGTGSGMWGSRDVTAAGHGGATHWTVPAKGLEETVVLALAKPPGLPLISALGDVGGFRHEDLTKVPSKALTGPLFTNTTGIDFAQAKPGFMVRVGLGGAQHGAYSTNGGVSFTRLAGVQEAHGVGFGKPAPGATYQALYLTGTGKGVAGVFRSRRRGFDLAPDQRRPAPVRRELPHRRRRRPRRVRPGLPGRLRPRRGVRRPVLIVLGRAWAGRRVPRPPRRGDVGT
ncbi:hypothetical protein ACFXKR_34855 [Streptomyces violascens]|uniref:hypothetical protein n=1 Tax=Streptomyces violascens TaxID=67381 RepID=UPI0036BC56C4